MTSYLNNKGERVVLKDLWRGIAEHNMALEGASLVLEKQMDAKDLLQVQKTLYFVLDGLAQLRATLQDDFQPGGYMMVRDGDQVSVVPTEEGV